MTGSLPLIMERDIDAFVPEENKSSLPEAEIPGYVPRQNIERHEIAVGRQLREVAMPSTGRQALVALQAANEHAAELDAALEQSYREITMLGEVSGQIQDCLTPEEAYTVASQFLPQLFPSEAGALYIISPWQNLAGLVTAWGAPASTLGKPAFAPDDCWAFRHGRMHLVGDMQDGRLCHHIETALPVPTAYLCVPLIGSNGALGILHLQRRPPAAQGARKVQPREAEEPLTEFRQRLALTVAATLALAFVNLELRGTLREQTIRDTLTGLFNHQYMKETLDRELHRATRTDSPLSVIVLELDYSRRFNDTYGRDAREAYLRSLGSFLQSHIRGEDIACRSHDDKFVLILPETPADVARQRAQQLQDEVKLVRVLHHGELLEPMTVSLGTATNQEQDATAESILEAAEDYVVRPPDKPLRLTVGPLVLNCYNFTIMVDERIEALTPVEFELLYFLMSRAGHVFTAEQLLRNVWRYPPNTGSPELVRVHIKNLRSKIEPDPKRPIYLRTVRRFGYSIRVDQTMSELSDHTTE